MSKREARISDLLLRSFTAVLACSCVVLNVGPTLAQDKGFSIFEDAADASSKGPVVSPQEAFTGPETTLPKSQFGTFGNTTPSTAGSSNVGSNGAGKPQLNGARAIGTYSQDGRKMFSQPPSSQSGNVRQLKPFTGNTLRPSDRPEPDEEANDSQPAPIVVGDFPKSTRRLGSAASESATENPAVAQQESKSKVAQVTFQDGGFIPSSRPASTGGSRFNPTPENSFGQTETPSNRFGAPAAQARSTFPPSTGQPRQRSQPLSPSPSQRREPSRLAPTQASAATQPPAIQRRNGFSTLGSSQTQRPPADRTAVLPTMMQNNGMQRNAAANARPASTSKAVSGSNAAKQLLTAWVESSSKLKLPGKQVKLHEFLAQPIRGSRKDAINQYWITFSDMANHQLAIEQSRWLDSIASPRQPTDQSVLAAAQQAARNRILLTEIQLAKSQSILGDYLPNFRDKNGNSIPVLPADVPWVGKLNTNLKKYQSRGIVPVRFNSIDEILPKARQLIANSADAVSAAGRAAEQAKQAMSTGNSPVANVLEAARIKSKNEEDFLGTVTGYNRAITDYVLSVRQDIYQPKRLASVLIGRKSVEPTLAKTKKQTPEEDVDPMASVAKPKMRQVATEKSAREPSVEGKSAYQLQNTTPTAPPAVKKSPFSQASISQPTSPPAEKQQKFDYGPTKESAAAAKFDPATVQAELPMQQTEQAGNSPGYSGNASRATPGQDRTAMGGGRQRLGARGQDDSTFGQSASTAPRPVEQRSAPAGRQDAASASGRFGGAGAFPKSTQPAAAPASGSGFSPGSTTPPASPATSAPKVSNPFSDTASPPADSTGDATTFNRFKGGGAGTFGGGATPQPSAASRFGAPGSTTRR
ncbi:hypothetical protein [Mariniblastus fucicola]|uniref:Uncharacterized protein n=1 Tax=Mariniblastus fucicola TaxID=980251 RepID=A0A5B9P7C2_9BACT|nr:hypothetical protein [Mariniblastus fucicola]QEG20850.1 hypothetical protein MFFC18_07010 [Mariniblastus fucicola]